MNKLLYFSLSLLFFANISAGPAIIIDEIDQLLKEQHILDLCRSEKKDNEHCKEINLILECAKPAGICKKIINFWNCPILDRGMVTVWFQSRAYDIGQEMGWNGKRIEKEWNLLLAEYDKAKQGK